MKAIILAAGVGSRFGKFTKENPKCLLTVGNETILGREIRILNEQGFKKEDIILMAGYKYEKLAGYDAKMIVNDKYDVTDNSYTLGLALRDVDDDVIIMDADLVFDGKIIKSIIDNPEPNVILTKMSEDLSESTGIALRDDGSIYKIGKHIKDSGYVYISIFKVGKSAVKDFRTALLSERSEKTWYTAPLTEILDKHRFVNSITDLKWHEVDYEEDYNETKVLFGFEEGEI